MLYASVALGSLCCLYPNKNATTRHYMNCMCMQVGNADTCRSPYKLFIKMSPVNINWTALGFQMKFSVLNFMEISWVVLELWHAYRLMNGIPIVGTLQGCGLAQRPFKTLFTYFTTNQVPGQRWVSLFKDCCCDNVLYGHGYCISLRAAVPPYLWWIVYEVT